MEDEGDGKEAKVTVETDRVLGKLTYTGHPLLDVGIAAITVFSNKRAPEEVTGGDCEKIAKWMAENYVQDPLKSFLTVAFPNSGYTQPAYAKKPEKREIYARNVLMAFQAKELPEKDHFLGLSVAGVPFDVKGELDPGVAYRQHVPLFSGEGVINFGPEGRPGLAMSGLTLLAFQALPLACIKCQGRLLAVHSEDRELMQSFAKRFMERMLHAVQLAREKGQKKLEEPTRQLGTLLVEELIQVLMDMRQRSRDEGGMRPSFSATAYHLTNIGQGPALDIYHLPSQVIGFLRLMERPRYREKWRAIVRKAWQKEKARARKTDTFVPKYNCIYEDLLRLPYDPIRQAARFIRCYFLRRPFQGRDAQDPRSAYDLRQESDLVSWDITQAFLRRIMNMDAERIEEIRQLADRLADYVRTENDTRLFRGMYRTNKYWQLRNILQRANLAAVRAGKEPLLKFDPYITVFEEGANELARPDWSLARDLVLIRMVEQLHEAGWFTAHKDELPEPEELAEEEETE